MPGMHGPGRGPGAMIGRGVKAKNARGAALRLWGYISSNRIGLFWVIVSVTISTGLTVLGPYLMGRAIDVYIMAGDRPGIVKVSLILLLVYIGASIFTWLEIIIMVGITQPALKKIRSELFTRLQGLSLRFFDTNPHGDLMSRFTNDVENISNVMTQSVTQLISSVLTIIGTASMMLALNPKFAAVTLVMLPVMVFFTKIIAGMSKKWYRRQQKNLGELNGFIEESIGGAKVVKAYGREEDMISRFEKVNRAYRDAGIRASIVSGVMGPMSNAVSNASYALIAFIGGYLVLKGQTTVGIVVTFINYTRQFSHPLNMIAGLYTSLQSALAGAERVFQTLDEKPEVQDKENAVNLDAPRGHVVFKNVTFSYTPGVPVLKDVNFETEAGRTFALVGPTGAGKTTIVNLLTRFYDIDEGSILLDGRDIREYTQDSLRRRLGIVLQDTYLFSGTVADNIRYGRLDASDEEIRRAAELANAHTFIHRFPHGYDTLLGESAGNLSEGQRQLLAIARAVLADPAVLILDEATSSVDTRTEKHIQEAMLRLMEGRTSFVIAHRLSTIRDADEILVIDGGRIVERGTHESLLERAGFYAEMYRSQFRGIAG